MNRAHNRSKWMKIDTDEMNRLKKTEIGKEMENENENEDEDEDENEKENENEKFVPTTANCTACSCYEKRN